MFNLNTFMANSDIFWIVILFVSDIDKNKDNL